MTKRRITLAAAAIAAVLALFLSAAPVAGEGSDVTFNVTVLDAADTPLAGVTVEIHAGGELVADGVTDSDGFVELLVAEADLEDRTKATIEVWDDSALLASYGLGHDEWNDDGRVDVDIVVGE